MSTFRRFNTSDSSQFITTAAYPQGILTWDATNGLRLHDGTTAGGNAVGGGGGNELVNGGYNFILGVDGTVNFTPSGANGKGVLQTTADLQFIANTAIYTFGTDGSLTVPGEIKTDAGTGPVVINSNDGATTRTWTFGSDGTTTLASGVEISNTGTFNFLSWNTGTALIIADVPYTAGSYIYIPSSSDTNGSLGIVNTNTAGSIMLTQGSGNGNTNNQLYVNNSGTTINNILGGISKTWKFGTDGSLTVPGDIKSTAGTGPVVINSNDGAITHTWTFGTYGSLLIPAGDADNTDRGQIFSDNESSFINLDVQFSSDITGGIRLGTFGPKPVDIVTNTNNGNHKWRFGADGALTFPQGGTLRVSGVPAHSTGAVGDKAGTVAFANGYIYYCTADYVPTQYPALAALTGANGVDNAYIVPNSYELPSVGWIIYYNNQTAVINQVNNGGNPGYYTVFTATPLFIPADSIFLYGPPSSDIWKRVAWSGDTW